MSRRFFSVGAPAIALGVLVLSAVAPHAQAAAFTNGGFDLGVFDDASANGHVISLPVGSTVLTGWTVVGGETAWARNDNAFIPNSATNGNYLLDLTGFHDSAPYGGVTQTVDTVLGNFYTLGFDLISFESDSRYRGPVALTASAGSVSQTFTFTPPAGSTGVRSSHFTLPFTATGTTTKLTLQGTLSTGGQFLGLDNVTLTPEPASLGLGIFSAAGFVLRRRRQGR
jgi:hypothetical protein